MIAPERNGVNIWLPQYHTGHHADVYRLPDGRGSSGWLVFRCNPTPLEVTDGKPTTQYHANVHLPHNSIRWDDKQLILIVPVWEVTVFVPWWDDLSMPRQHPGAMT